MSIDGKRRSAAACFVALLTLAVYWPAPVLTIDDICCHQRLTIDDLSFLGREAPSWDVVFWCIAGIYLIAVLQVFPFAWRDFRKPWGVIRSARLRVVSPRFAIAFAAIAAILIVATWRWLDVPVTGWAERVDSSSVEDTIRVFNRLGGGMNPALIVLFFVILGVVAAHRQWLVDGVAMGLAGAAAGITAQAVKFAVARIRPELWLGPFVRAQHGATSFPSGHTIGAFALSGVLLIRSRSTALRSISLLLAIAIGFARILAFRHWASDVVASALLGLFAAYVAAAALEPSTTQLHESSVDHG